MTDEAPPVVVIDNGSASLKVGAAGGSSPDVVFPSVYGKPKVMSLMRIELCLNFNLFTTLKVAYCTSVLV